MKSRDESRASIDAKNLDAKIERERPLYTQGPCDSACGSQHEGVASLVPADAAPGTAVNRDKAPRQEKQRRLQKGKGTMVGRQHEDATQQELTLARSQLEALGHKASRT